MSKYNVHVRRKPTEDWSAWGNTNDIETYKNYITTIQGYGYEWTDETLMDRREFKIACFNQGVEFGAVDNYVTGRRNFNSADVKYLTEVVSNEKSLC